MNRENPAFLEPSDDDALREQLRAADPAASLSPADPAAVDRLLEATMDDQLTDESRRDGLHRRSPLTWIVAAAAVVVVALGVTLIVTHDSDPAPVADPSPTSGTTSQTTPADPTTAPAAPTELTVGGVSARCMVPSAALLKQQTLAFSGTVTDLAGGVATLSVDHVYTGDPGDTVTVAAPDADLQALLAAVQFQDGGRYLVAATDGRVAVCGYSAPYAAPLAGLYDQAFGK